MYPQQGVETVITKLGIRDFDQCRLGPEGDSQAGLLDHQPIIGSVADPKHVFVTETKLLTRLDQRLALDHGIDDRVADLAGGSRQIAGRGPEESLRPERISSEVVAP